MAAAPMPKSPQSKPLPTTGVSGVDAGRVNTPPLAAQLWLIASICVGDRKLAAGRSTASADPVTTAATAVAARTSPVRRIAIESELDIISSLFLSRPLCAAFAHETRSG